MCMKWKNILKNLPGEKLLKAQPRAYSNHSIEFKKVFSAEERAKKLEEVGLNVFFYPSEMITGCDLLSDSGTTTMTNEQWAALHMGDESYGSNRGYFKLSDQIRKTFGDSFFNKDILKPNAFIFHQGRSCEDAFFKAISDVGSNLIIPSNGHFDTTQANIEKNNMRPLNLFSSELKNGNNSSRFKGNMDVESLREVLKNASEKIPVVFLTITNNTGGGQPVSMENIKQTSRLCHEYSVPLFFDACRFAENAWFIKNYEKKYRNEDIGTIVKEMFSYADGFDISFKKDGLANIGGGLFLKEGGLFLEKYPSIPSKLIDYQIIKEGHPTYGGLSGRDIMTIIPGLQTITNEQYLNHRINQVQEFGNKMHDLGLPVLMPIGGHAVYLDIDKFFEGTKIAKKDFGGISFTAILLAAYGHRACELGNFAFGSFNKETGEEAFPEINFVRFAVPRLKYEQQDLFAVVEAVKAMHDARHEIPKIKVTHGKDLTLRHFKAQFCFEEQE